MPRKQMVAEHQPVDTSGLPVTVDDYDLRIAQVRADHADAKIDKAKYQEQIDALLEGRYRAANGSDHQYPDLDPEKKHKDKTVEETEEPTPA